MLLLLVFLPLASSQDHLRVMTFNIWQSGQNVENGIQKLAKHILLLDPDIVCLQENDPIQKYKSNFKEVYEGAAENLTLMMGFPWVHVIHKGYSYIDTAILTKHIIAEGTQVDVTSAVGVKIFLRTGQTVNIWSAHLDYRSYGPYAANNKMVTDIHQILIGEKDRGAEILQLIQNPMNQKWMNKSCDFPLIVAGDFNGPSHLDWNEAAKHIHGDWEVPWPATVELAKVGFQDSFRQLYPDNVKYPGNTWSTVNKFNAEWSYTIPEPQDRIDFIHYLGALKPISSFIYSGTEPLTPIPNHHFNDYPSDHYAVVTDFTFTKGCDFSYQ